MSRNSQDEVVFVRDARSLLAKVDIGAYGEPGLYRDPDGSVSMLAGEPLLGEGDRSQSRHLDLQSLHAEWKRERWGLLERARGAFCAVHYHPATESLFIVSDKLGIRPLYYFVTDRLVAFATTLRILEGAPDLPKQMDIRAVTEMVALGIPLGARTPYAAIKLMRAAEVIQVAGEKLSRWQYWRWDQIAESSQPEPQLLADVHQRFRNAVATRIRGESATSAFLSGGLDSRCVVAELRARRVNVRTFTFGPADSQDQVFGADFARRAETRHQADLVAELVNPEWSVLMARAMSDSSSRGPWPSDRPHLVWSGDGGSAGLGHIYLSRKTVDLMRSGSQEAAVESFIDQEKAFVPRNLLQRDLGQALSRAIREGILEELADIGGGDPGRAFHIFLLLNGQRRLLANHFENIDLHRLELQLPFFDSDLLRSIIAVPLDLCLGHRFYGKLLQYLPPIVTQVPWQTYPDHEPCPLAVSGHPRDQWTPPIHSGSGSRKQRVISKGSTLLRAADFAREILDRRSLRLAVLIHRTGFRDYAYMVEAASTYQKYWSLCGGHYVLDSEATPAFGG